MGRPVWGFPCGPGDERGGVHLRSGDLLVSSMQGGRGSNDGMQVSTTAFAAALLQPRLEAVTSPLAPDAGVPAWWEELFHAACNRSVFLSRDWMQSWLEVYERDFDGVWVRWEHRGATVGGCLLLTRVVWRGGVPMRSLFVNATGEAGERTPLAEYNDVLHVGGHELAIAADLARIVRAMRWSRLLLSGHREGSLLGRLARLVPAALVEHDPRPAPYVDLASLPASFEATLNGKGGSQIRRNTRLYEKEHGPCRVTVADSLEQAMHFFEDLSILHRTSWESRGHSGSFSSNAVRDFHRRLIRRLWRQQAVDLVRVGNEQAVIGYLYNFTSEAKVYYFQSGFAYRDGCKLSPGLLTHCLAIEHYRQRGWREYDFLAGDVRYKRSLANECRALHWTVVYRDRAWVRFLLWLRAMRGRLATRPDAPLPGGAH